jgi:hypothetical protein
MLIDLSFKNLEIGSQVKTRKGFLWTKLSDGKWRDETSTLIWLPEIKTQVNHYQALELENSERRLPTKEEFEDAEDHGIREILELNEKVFWSSTAHPNDAAYAFVFNGNYGDIYYDDRDYSYYYYSALCVGR